MNWRKLHFYSSHAAWDSGLLLVSPIRAVCNMFSLYMLEVEVIIFAFYMLELETVIFAPYMLELETTVEQRENYEYKRYCQGLQLTQEGKDEVEIKISKKKGVARY